MPKEVKNHEYRVAITPIGVHELVAPGHVVVIQENTGVGRRPARTPPTSPSARP